MESFYILAISNDKHIEESDVQDLVSEAEKACLESDVSCNWV
jgi:signal recognition particle GTPase